MRRAAPSSHEAGVVAAAFHQLYADPVLVNGAPFPVAALVERARDLHAAFEGLQLELVDRVDGPGRVAIAHRNRGRHVGPLATPLGEVPATGHMVETLGIDILTVADDLITEIWVAADELGRLLQLGAVTLA
jgi:hypothetical protein